MQSKINFHTDTREGRRAARRRKFVSHVLAAIGAVLFFCCALVSLGWAISQAPTMQPNTAEEAAQWVAR